MRYASIRSMDISNGEGVGISLFVQGCKFRCKNCFNKDTWDFDGGEEWTPEVKKRFIELANRPYIKRISILGGEPLADENLDEVLNLINEMRVLFPQKTIWLYSGYTWEEIMNSFEESKKFLQASWKDLAIKRYKIVSKCDVFIDGRYVEELRDVSLKCKWRGSSNQKVLDVKKSLEQKSVVLYCD